ncbi:group I intron-associated PD-(D/E)XK endonuclease [Haloarcula sediminis]|uniref:group I intron-associated PD-(D/E)XK endonuclease n=1 Tax=Haloarcula sediminis TaxID=3111777 RepID=UPI002D78F5C5|nr:group I intron-associated PD-(D/E)XK endonuclease [Haloarcula sp. CK38]
MNGVEQFHQLNQTQKRGQAVEAVLKTQFQLRGIPTLVPEYDNQPYDFVIELGSELYKIQAKTAYEGQNDGTIRFETRTTRVKSAGYEREGYADAIDFFAVFDPITESCYLVDVEAANSNTMTLRYESAKKDSDRINWTADFTLDSVLEQIHPAKSDPTS